MPDAVIVDAVRTAVGRRNGRLRDWHPVDLAAEPLRALIERHDLDPVPIGSTTEPGPGEAYGPRVLRRYDFVHQGASAQMIADKWGVSRDEMDELSLRSHQRAGQAIDEGRFEREIVPVEVDGEAFVVD